jgi:hypothetical protein
MAAIGATITDSRITSLLPAFGAALVAAGLVAVVLSSDLSAVPSIGMGGTLIAAGVIAALAGLSTGSSAVIATLPVIGAAIATAGIVAVLHGAQTHQMGSRNQ